MITDTYQLIGAVKQMYPVVQFFKDRYFPDGRSFYSEEVLIDSKKQGKKIAPFVIPMRDGIAFESEGFRTDRITAPTIAIKKAITPDDLEKRAFGEDPNSNRTPADRQDEIAADHLDELRNAIYRRFEAMCTEIITTGAVVIKQFATAEKAAAGTEYQERLLKFYDGTFGNRYVLGKKLENMTAAEKIDALYKMCTILHKRGFKAADLVITSDVASIFFGDADFLEYYNKLNVHIGQIAPVETPDGVVFSGTLNVRGTLLNIFIYDEYYVDLDGQEKAFLPTGTMAILSPGLGQTVYGQITFLTRDNTFASYAEKIVPRIVGDEEDNVLEVQVFSRPVPFPTFTDGWIFADATRHN